MIVGNKLRVVTGLAVFLMLCLRKLELLAEPQGRQVAQAAHAGRSPERLRDWPWIITTGDRTWTRPIPPMRWGAPRCVFRPGRCT